MMDNSNVKYLVLPLVVHKNLLKIDKDYFDKYHTAFTLVDSFFKDKDKTEAWFETPNPNLGGIEPYAMLFMETRYKKLLAFINNQLDGNIP